MLLKQKEMLEKAKEVTSNLHFWFQFLPDNVLPNMINLHATNNFGTTAGFGQTSIKTLLNEIDQQDARYVYDFQ